MFAFCFSYVFSEQFSPRFKKENQSRFKLQFYKNGYFFLDFPKFSEFLLRKTASYFSYVLDQEK